MTITTDQLLSQKTGKLYLHYFIPSICGSLMGCLYGFADILFIGRGAGSDALAALNIATPVYAFINTVTTLIGVGGAVAMSVSLGRGEKKEANQFFSLSTFLLCVFSALMMLFGWLFLEPLSLFLGATPEILEGVMTYLGTILWGVPGFLLNWALSTFVRNDGNPKLVMWASVIPNIFNVVFDYIFVFPCQMGIFGAALASALSPYLGLGIVMLHFLFKRNTIRLVNPLRSFHLLWRVVKNGSGYSVLEATNGILIFTFNQVLISLGGEPAVSAYAVVLNLGWIVLCIIQGFVQAAQPIISVNYGAGKIRRCMKSFYLSGFWGVLVATVVTVFLVIEPTPLVSLFTEGDASLTQLASSSGRCYFSMIIFMGITVTILNLTQSCEQMLPSLLISLGRGLVFPMIGLFLLTGLFGLDGAWWAVPFGEAVTLVMAALFFLHTRNKIKKLEGQVIHPQAAE